MAFPRLWQNLALNDSVRQSQFRVPGISSDGAFGTFIYYFVTRSIGPSTCKLIYGI
jgi:hypothetical protein